MTDPPRRLQDLPSDGLQALREQNTQPLWPSLRVLWRDVQRASGEPAAVTPRDEAVQLANAANKVPACLFVVDGARSQRKPGIREVLSSTLR